MNEQRIFCLDSSVLIEGWNKYYSPRRVPDYWDILEDLGRREIVFSPIDVLREIEKVDDDLKTWCTKRKYMFREITTDIQIELRKIMKAYPRLVDSTRQRSVADPWVIAFAIAHKATVVTKEMPIGSDGRRVKIPDVCSALGVKCIDDFTFADLIGLRFTATLDKTIS